MRKLTVVLITFWLVCIFAIPGHADPTVTRDGNHIYIYGDTVANDGDFDVYAALGLTVGIDILYIDHWCWYGGAIAIGDEAELEISDNKPIGCPFYAVVADQPMCTRALNMKVTSIYVDELAHGSIVIVLKRTAR